MGIFDLFRKKKEETGFLYSCEKCGVRWDPQRMEMLYGGFALVSAIVKPGTSQYAGRFPTCGKLYCARCASFSGVTFQCPKCNATLKAALHG